MDQTRPGGTQLTLLPARNPQTIGSGQKWWSPLQNRGFLFKTSSSSMQGQLNAIRGMSPGSSGPEMCAQSITSSPAHSQAPEPSTRRHPAEDMQRRPKRLHPASPTQWFLQQTPNPTPTSPTVSSSPCLQHLFFCMANKELLRADAHLVSEPEAGNREAQAL